MKIKENDFAAIALIVLGAFILLLPGAIVELARLAVYAIAIAVAVLGLIDLLQKKWISGLIKLIAGIAIFLLTLLVLTDDVLRYVLAAVLILFGAYLVYCAIKSKPKGALNWVLALAMPILSIVAGILLILNINIVDTIVAIVLIVDGLLIILNDYVFNK